MFKLITLATLLIGTVNCYQETAFSNYQDAFSNYQEYFQEPIKPQNGLAIARQALGGLSSGGAALIGVVSFEGFFYFLAKLWDQCPQSIQNENYCT